MSKTVKRWILDDGWSIGRNECWFADMAAKGLHLQSVGRFFVSFAQGKPSKTKYRIDVLSTRPTREQMEVYEECGWKFIANRGEFYIFSSPEEADCPELHTDPIEQGYTLTALDKRLRNNLLLLSLLMLLFCGMMFSLFILDRTPTLSMMEAAWIQRPLLVLVELYVFYTVIRNYMAVRRLRNSLLQGNPLDHRESWRKPRLINGSVALSFILLAVISICIPFVGIAKSKDYTLPETPVNLPVVRLSEMERNPDLEREVIYNRHGVDWGNRVSYDWSLLAPVQYEISEHGLVENLRWEDDSGKYSPSMETRYYRLRFPQMADGLIHDLIDRYVDRFDPKVSVQEKGSSFFAKLFVAEDGIRKQVFASYGNEIIYVSYYGNGDMENIVTLLPQAIMQYSDSKS